MEAAKAQNWAVEPEKKKILEYSEDVGVRINVQKIK
jgi:hypothetical protein